MINWKFIKSKKMKFYHFQSLLKKNMNYFYPQKNFKKKSKIYFHKKALLNTKNDKKIQIKKYYKKK